MKSMIKSKKGISPILATLLLIVIAVAAVIVTYAWVITFTENTTSNAGALLKHENVRFDVDGTTNYVEIVVRNTGTGDAQVDTIYMGTSASNLMTQTGVAFTPGTGIVAAGDTLTIRVTYAWVEGTNYYFKITTEEGFELPFTKEA
jgi:flagellin-like protein